MLKTQNNTKAYLLFDGNCGLCVKTIGFLTKISNFGNVKFINLWEIDKYRLFKKINTEQLVQEIHLVDERGKVHKGYFAFKYLFSFMTFFGIVTNIPGVDTVGKVFYSLISRYRYQIFPCKTCHIPLQKDSNF